MSSMRAMNRLNSYVSVVTPAVLDSTAPSATDLYFISSGRSLNWLRTPC